MAKLRGKDDGSDHVDQANQEDLDSYNPNNVHHDFDVTNMNNNPPFQPWQLSFPPFAFPMASNGAFTDFDFHPNFWNHGAMIFGQTSGATIPTEDIFTNVQVEGNSEASDIHPTASPSQQICPNRDTALSLPKKPEAPPMQEACARGVTDLTSNHGLKNRNEHNQKTGQVSTVHTLQQDRQGDHPESRGPHPTETTPTLSELRKRAKESVTRRTKTPTLPDQGSQVETIDRPDLGVALQVSNAMNDNGDGNEGNVDQGKKLVKETKRSRAGVVPEKEVPGEAVMAPPFSRGAPLKRQDHISNPDGNAPSNDKDDNCDSAWEEVRQDLEDLITEGKAAAAASSASSASKEKGAKSDGEDQVGRPFSQVTSIRLRKQESHDSLEAGEIRNGIEVPTTPEMASSKLGIAAPIGRTGEQRVKRSDHNSPAVPIPKNRNIRNSHRHPVGKSAKALMQYPNGANGHKQRLNVHKQDSFAPFQEADTSPDPGSAAAQIRPDLAASTLRDYRNESATTPKMSMAETSNVSNAVIQDWLNITGFHDLAFRDKMLTRHSKLRVIEEEKCRLLNEADADDSSAAVFVKPSTILNAGSKVIARLQSKMCAPPSPTEKMKQEAEATTEVNKGKDTQASLKRSREVTKSMDDVAARSNKLSRTDNTRTHVPRRPSTMQGVPTAPASSTRQGYREYESYHPRYDGGRAGDFDSRRQICGRGDGFVDRRRYQSPEFERPCGRGGFGSSVSGYRGTDRPGRPLRDDRPRPYSPDLFDRTERRHSDYFRRP